MNQFKSSQNIGDIVAEFPKAADIFKEYRIDFCCGGGRPVISAINEQGLDEKEIMDKLNNLYEAFAGEMERMGENWREAKPAELVDWIVSKHHAHLWKTMPQISELSTLILTVHGAHHPELAKVHRLFHTLKTELEAHMIKEETVQYPAIRKYSESNAKEDLKEALIIIDELEGEHTTAGNILKGLRNVTSDFVIPDDVCETFEATYAKLQEMEGDIFQHIHLENNILFPLLRKQQTL